MDFYKIGALKVFADIGALIDEDESKQEAIKQMMTLKLLQEKYDK